MYSGHRSPSPKSPVSQEPAHNAPINLTLVQLSRQSQPSESPKSFVQPAQSIPQDWPIQDNPNADTLQMLSAQIASLAEAIQSLQTRPAAQNPAPQIVHPPKALLQPNVDPQARTEIEQLKRTIKNLAKLKSALINDPFDDLPRIILPPNCPLDFRKYNGTTNPLHHIKTFKIETRPYVGLSVPAISGGRHTQVVLHPLYS